MRNQEIVTAELGKVAVGPENVAAELEKVDKIFVFLVMEQCRKNPKPICWFFVHKFCPLIGRPDEEELLHKCIQNIVNMHCYVTSAHLSIFKMESKTSLNEYVKIKQRVFVFT